MDRKQFFKSCAGGLCACAAVMTLPAQAADPAPAKEDWRLPFIQKRYAKMIRKSLSGDIITYDRARGVITMTTDERHDCFCPLNSAALGTPGVVCNCPLGWHTHSWESITGRKVEVKLIEAVLRGGSHCTFEITILPEPA